MFTSLTKTTLLRKRFNMSSLHVTGRDWRDFTHTNTKYIDVQPSIKPHAHVAGIILVENSHRGMVV